MGSMGWNNYEFAQILYDNIEPVFIHSHSILCYLFTCFVTFLCYKNIQTYFFMIPSMLIFAINVTIPLKYIKPGIGDYLVGMLIGLNMIIYAKYVDKHLLRNKVEDAV